MPSATYWPARRWRRKSGEQASQASRGPRARNQVRRGLYAGGRGFGLPVPVRALCRAVRGRQFLAKRHADQAATAFPFRRKARLVRERDRQFEFRRFLNRKDRSTPPTRVGTPPAREHCLKESRAKQLREGA